MASLPARDRNWLDVHEELTRLAKRRAHSEWEEGRGLLVAQQAGVHRQLGFGSFFEYVETLFGYKPRSIDEKLRVARALEALPELDEDLRNGTSTWSTIRELTRVATAETEGAWRQAARGKTVRQVEELVAGRQPGARPDSPVKPELRRHVLAFEVRAETFAMVREAFAKLRHDAGEPLDEEGALFLMARHVLGGSMDAGRASYQVAFTVCERCGRGAQHGHGDKLDVDIEVIEMASCDAQHIGHVDSIGASCDIRSTQLNHDAAHVGDAHEGRNDAHEDRNDAHEDCNGAHEDRNDAHEDRNDAHEDRNGAHEDRNDAHVGDHKSSSVTRSRFRATQTVPPATRRLVLHRDGGSCVVPGCRNARFLDVHHLQPRSEGGGHDPDKLVVLCGAHHRALHRGRLVAEGVTAKTLIFRHADGSIYRQAVAPRAAESHARAFIALRKLGFRESEVRRALDRVGHELGTEPTPEQVLRAALRRLAPATSLFATSGVG